MCQRAKIGFKMSSSCVSSQRCHLLLKSLEALLCHELATQVNTSLWGQNELHNDWGDELFTRRLPLKIGNEQRYGCHQARQPLQQTLCMPTGLTQKNIEFLSFDMQQKMNSTMRIYCISWCLKFIFIFRKVVSFFIQVSKDCNEKNDPG